MFCGNLEGEGEREGRGEGGEREKGKELLECICVYYLVIPVINENENKYYKKN